MLRKIIYGIFGGIGGGLIGAILEFYFSVADYVWFLIGVFGVAGAFLGIWVASRINQKEKQYFVDATDIASHPLRSYVYIILVILGIQAVLSLAIIFIAASVLGMKLFDTLFALDNLAAFTLNVLLAVLLAWVAVWFVSHKGFLKKFHSPVIISLAVVVFNAIPTIVKVRPMPFSSVTLFLLEFCILAFFLHQKIKKLAQDETNKATS